MSLKTMRITAKTEGIRLLGRLDPAQDPIALDWTGSGIEFRFRGTDAWARLEATESAPVMWMIVLADGCPVTRFPVERGNRFYPLVLGLEAERERTITLMKETQCMPDSPAATVLLRSLKIDGELTELPPRERRIEFIGDSLTSGEGALAPKGNEEWVTPWFSARGNYSWYACEVLNADRHILSQSGWGVCWDWQHDREHNMTDIYEYTAGVLRGPEVENRGCRKRWDFSAWQPDAVCIRLTTNDANGMNALQSLNADREELIHGCMNLIRKVRENNPVAKIVWILPGTGSHPEMAEEAVRRSAEAGMKDVFSYALPDFGEEDLGARGHPNAEWNRMAGGLLAEYLKTVMNA